MVGVLTVNYLARDFGGCVVALKYQIAVTNVINDTKSGNARLQNFKFTSHGVKPKYLDFHDLLLSKSVREAIQ